MTETKIYIEKFTNEYGEDFFFDYNSQNDMGIIWGDDIGVDLYVFDGKCPPIILNMAEKEWLQKSWNRHSNKSGLYLNNSITLKSNKKYYYLSDNYCPICLSKQDRFEDHHCIPACEGGSDDNVNLLHICASCHLLITSGCQNDSRYRNLTAIYHQIANCGIDFYKMNPLNNKRYENKDMGLYKYRPYIEDTLNHYNNLEYELSREDFNNRLKEESIYFYKYYRSLVRGIIKEDVIND